MDRMAELVIGPFLGVIGAFASQRAYNKYKSSQERKKLKQNLKGELNVCVNLLTGKGNLVPTAMWKSAISAGDIALLSFTDRSKLSAIYFEIDNHNYEAKRVRDSAVVAQTGSRRELCNGMPAAQAYWVGLSKSLISEEELLKQKIIEFLKDPLW